MTEETLGYTEKELTALRDNKFGVVQIRQLIAKLDRYLADRNKEEEHPGYIVKHAQARTLLEDMTKEA